LSLRDGASDTSGPSRGEGASPPAAADTQETDSVGGGAAGRPGEGDRYMRKYVCTVCDWVYDPAKGDPDGGIEAGTAFEDLPEDWVCPECAVGKDLFEPLDE